MCRQKFFPPHPPCPYQSGRNDVTRRVLPEFQRAEPGLRDIHVNSGFILKQDKKIVRELCCWYRVGPSVGQSFIRYDIFINPLNPELNPICYLLALLGAHHFLHVSRIRGKLLTFRRLMSYIYIWSTHS